MPKPFLTSGHTRDQMTILDQIKTLEQRINSLKRKINSLRTMPDSKAEQARYKKKITDIEEYIENLHIKFDEIADEMSKNRDEPESVVLENDLHYFIMPNVYFHAYALPDEFFESPEELKRKRIRQRKMKEKEQREMEQRRNADTEWFLTGVKRIESDEDEKSDKDENVEIYKPTNNEKRRAEYYFEYWTAMQEQYNDVLNRFNYLPTYVPINTQAAQRRAFFEDFSERLMFRMGSDLTVPFRIDGYDWEFTMVTVKPNKRLVRFSTGMNVDIPETHVFIGDYGEIEQIRDWFFMQLVSTVRDYRVWSFNLTNDEKKRLINIQSDIIKTIGKRYDINIITTVDDYGNRQRESHWEYVERIRQYLDPYLSGRTPGSFIVPADSNFSQESDFEPTSFEKTLASIEDFNFYKSGIFDLNSNQLAQIPFSSFLNIVPSTTVLETTVQPIPSELTRDD